MLLTLACLTGAQAQRFEWAKGYASSQQGTEIKGQVADREGNLYILGTFRNDSRWDGEPLLPMTPYGYFHDNNNVLIAKISPTGQMLWKKVIHGNNGQGALAHDIKPVGDTAFACLVEATLPAPTSYEYCYYLDTLLTELDGYPIAPFEGAWMNGWYTILLIFDFSGRVLEQHFLKVTYTDSLGNDIVTQVGSNVTFDSYPLRDPSFDIDAEGNIYLSRMAFDYIDAERCVETGVIQGLKFWADHRMVGTVHFADKPSLYNLQLLAFSPHFDTLLASRYLFQHYVGHIPNTYLRLDRYGDLYALGSVVVRGINDTIVVDAERGISFPITAANYDKGYLVKLDSALTPIYCVTLEDSVVNPDLLYSTTIFQDVSFDYDSSIVFLCSVTGIGAFGDTNNLYSVLMYRGQALENIKNDVFFLAFRMSDGSLESYGKVPSIWGSDLITGSHGNIVSNGNRIFMQSKYAGGIHLPDTSIFFSSRYDESIGMQIFDYRGNVVGGLHYAATNPSKTGSISLVDSILYISNLLRSSATFGDIFVPYQGYHACIARYVDTAFMTPYRALGDTGDVSIRLVEDEGAWTSYPNPFRQRVNIQVQGSDLLAANGVATAVLTDLQGRREEVRLERVGAGHYVLDLTSRPQASYLLTLTTSSGKQHTLKLLKQSDRFGD